MRRAIVCVLLLAVSASAGCKKNRPPAKGTTKPNKGVAKSVLGKWLWVATEDQGEPKSPMKLESFEWFKPGGDYELTTPSQHVAERGTWKQSGATVTVQLKRVSGDSTLR